MLQRAAACSDSPTSTGQQSHSAEGAEPPLPVLYVILWMGLAPHPTLSAVCISAVSHGLSGSKRRRPPEGGAVEDAAKYTASHSGTPEQPWQLPPGHVPGRAHKVPQSP